MLAFVAKNYYFLTTDINEDGAYFTPGGGGNRGTVRAEFVQYR